MNCRQCGNEVQPEEVFCGQCGTATNFSVSPTNMVNSVPLGIEDVTILYGDTSHAPQQIRTPHPQTAPHPQTRKLFSPPRGLFTSSHYTQKTPGVQERSVDGKQQQTEFYQNLTEAISLPSSDVVLGQAYDKSQQVLPDLQAQKDLSAIEQHRLSARLPIQSLQADQQGLSRSVHSGQGYDYVRPVKFVVPPQTHKQHSSAIVLIVSLCIIIVLVSSIAITTFFLRGSFVNNGSASPTFAAQPTVEPTATPMPQDTPTPTAVPTPLPDAGFTWCGPTCTNYGFSVEYPVGWQLGGTPTNNGIQFTNPAQPDQTATFKTLGSTSGSAGDLLNSELQANFMTKSGYAPPQGTGVTTLGGGTWLATTVYYQGTGGYNSSINQQLQATDGYNPSVNQQREHVAIYTIVYQSKGYVIEIQAPDPDGQQFTLIYNTYYAAMLSKFSFV
jgi:hypothetical protein